MLCRTLSFVKLSKKRKLVIKQPSYGFEYLIHSATRHEHHKMLCILFFSSLVPKNIKSLKGFSLNVLEISFFFTWWDFKRFLSTLK